MKLIRQNLFTFIIVAFGFYLMHRFGETPPVRSVKHVNLAATFGEIPLLPLGHDGAIGATSGTAHLLEQAKGRTTIVNFWASWCGSCQKETGALKTLWDLYKDDLHMVGISSSDTREGLAKSTMMADMPYDLYFDEKGDLATAFGMASLPNTYVFDGDGKVRYVFKGPILEGTLTEAQAVLDGLIEEQKFGIDAIAASTAGEVESAAGHGLPIFGALDQFKLTDSAGKLFSRDSLSDDVWLVNFVFTSCESLCPLLTQEMQKLGQQFANRPKLKMLSISVDPERDTPEKLRAYGERFGADPMKWVFATGEWLPIKELMTQGFRIVAPEEPVFHTEKIVLVDGQMRIRGYYSATSAEALERLSRDVNRLFAAAEETVSTQVGVPSPEAGKL